MNLFKQLSQFLASDDGSTKDKTVRSAIWVAIGQSLFMILSLVRSVVLARLLIPEMFGLMGLCSIVIQTVETFTRPGIGQALIQRQSSFSDARDTAFTLLVLRGVLLTAILALIAPVAARFYESDELANMLFVLSSIFIIGGLANINIVAQQKELSFKSLTYLGQVTTVISTLSTIALAIWLRNVWALVYGQIIAALVNCLLSYYFVSGTPRFSFNRKIAKELISYGKFITASSIVLFLASSLDTAVIGKVLGTELLGFYVLAFTFANIITSGIAKLISSVLMPAYAKLQNDRARLRSAYLQTISLITLVTAPAAAGIYILAEPLVIVVFGENWAAASGPLQILVIFGLLRAITAATGYLFEGIGKPQFSLYAGACRLLVLAALILPLSYTYGISGAALAVTIAMSIQLIMFIFLSRSALDLHVGDFARAIGPPLWKSMAMGILVFYITTLIDTQKIPGLVLAIMSGALIYILLNIKSLKQAGDTVFGSLRK